MAVMNSKTFVEKAKQIANNYKTLYVLGCFGAPLNVNNKFRYTHNYSYNEQPSRAKKINAASADTFGFDCVCLIKGILWGWDGNVNATYGGAKYASNGVPDVGADQMMNYCHDVSTDFSNIKKGELVHTSGHIGIYIGDGLAVECTPIWADKVQITAVGNIGTKAGYNTRYWTNHGKSNFIDYSDEEEESFLSPRGWLTKGDSGEKIIKVDDWFANHVKGNYFGDYTEACVKVFQRQNGLEDDGNIGPITLAKMEEQGFKE